MDELILSFTHDVELHFMLPGIPPTGKEVELPHVVVMKFEGDKIATSTSTGTRHRSSHRWACSIRKICRCWCGTGETASRADQKVKTAHDGFSNE